MPQVEITSPLTSTQVEVGFRVTGWTDQPNKDITCTVSKLGGVSQTLTPRSDGDGNWMTVVTTVPVADDYTVSVSMTVDTDTFSDVNEDVDVCNGINLGGDPIPINIGNIISRAAKHARVRTLTIRGRYSSSPNPNWILVQVVIMRRKKSSRVFSAGSIDSPSGNAWTIDLPAPTATAHRRVVVQAIRFQANDIASGQTTQRV